MKFQISNGSHISNFVYVINLVEAHILAAEALPKAYGERPPPTNSRVDGGKFNITDAERVLLWGLARNSPLRRAFGDEGEDLVVSGSWLDRSIQGVV